MDRILVTGLGVISALGDSVAGSLEMLRAGKSGISDAPALLGTSLKVPVGEVRMTNAELLGYLGLDVESVVSRTALLAASAAVQAVNDAGLDRELLSGGRAGLILGTSVGGMDLTEHFYREFSEDSCSGDLKEIGMHDCGASAEFVARHIGFKGFATTVSTACSSAGNAIMTGARMIRAGLIDAAIVGGSDALSCFTMNGFNSLRILSSRPCRPFDADRDGLNLGEGAGFLVLQREGTQRGDSYCSISGWANTNEAFHQTASSASGDGASLSMGEALRNAGLSPDDIDYINAHGTATPGNDLAEGTAVRRVFGGGTPFGSFKAYTGHTLGASEGIEAVFCALSLKYGELWSSAGFAVEDPEIGLRPLCGYHRNGALRHILSNSFGFGGNDTTLIFSAI